MTYPDTNYVLRYLLQDHEEHFRLASAYWNQLREDTLKGTLTEGVLLECVYVLQKFYKVPKMQIAQTLGGLLAYPGLKQEPEDLFTQALELFQRKNLDFVDCLLLSRESLGKGKVMTFDLKMKAKRIEEGHHE